MGTRTRRAAAGVAAAVLVTAIPAVARPLMTRSDAARIAQSSNLTAADMPGYTVTPATQSRGEDIWGGSRYARCAKRKAYGRDLADVVSPTFERESPGRYDAVGSEVEVMPNSQLAAKDIAIAKSKLGQRCLKREMLRFKPPNLNLDNFSAKRLSGFNNGVAYRIKLTVTDQGMQVPIYIDIFAFAEREAEGAVFFIAGPTPPNRSDENHLVNTVLTRVDKQVYKNDIF
jgi:hypothetical protein